jgi:hypothetical protein
MKAKALPPKLAITSIRKHKHMKQDYLESLLDKFRQHDSATFEQLVAPTLPIEEDATAAFQRAANEFINNTDLPRSELSLAELSCLYSNPSRPFINRTATL